MDIKFETFMPKMEAKLTSEKERHEREMDAVREEFKKTIKEERDSHKRELHTTKETRAAQVQQLEQMVNEQVLVYQQQLEQQTKENEAKIEQHTGPGGYKMRLRVDANGNGSGTGTHVSVYVCLMRGEHDDQLKWPFQGDITIQLLNQKRDREHVEGIIQYSDAAIADGYAARVTSGERATKGWGVAKFISNSAVESTTETTQYLHNDCLKWRVTNIVVYSV